MENVIISENCKKAVSLDIRIKTHAKSAQEHLFEVCKGLKEMRDGKLYKELGYQNFEDYTENEIGIKRRQAYKYITIAETFNSENVHSSAQIGSTKLYLLTKIDEASRAEIAENTNLEKTSVKELEAKIKEINRLKKELDKANEDNEALSDRIDELESRPVEVAVADSSHEIENMRKAMNKCDIEWRTAYDKLQEENIAESRKHHQEIERIKADYEQKISAANAEFADDKAVFKAYFANAVDSAKRLMEFISSQKNSENYEFYRDKTAEFVKTIMKEA